MTYKLKNNKEIYKDGIGIFYLYTKKSLHSSKIDYFLSNKQLYYRIL